MGNLEVLQETYTSLSLEQGLKQLSLDFPGKVVFTTSFGLEDQAITHAILANQIDIRIATLDTGRLFQETYDVWQKTNIRYGVRIEAFYPNEKEIQSYVEENGPNAFYDSQDLRKECCRIRKLVPLDTILKDTEVWVTGLRKDQSGFRTEMSIFETDTQRNLIKYQPLLLWSFEDTWKYIREHNVPYNLLHDKGFPSIGCAPCTRAIEPGEDFRAGRWWWEQESKKECGLHWVDGKLTPKKG
ncbi:phosphoadenylyl-sulfate reductase [Leptospira brenneri]|uniref:Adenosine 5'-phosphosulfate reductase n=1 Tax=Leptospira brenneri TaxID=2023182 RepID=A0A2M9XXN7_9LEPT|nr:phosphoadenylyl-sulfate reductase [Leptospira brenneri]PJZ44039.1 phosphoadenosine phosphosulfate reductase [Leptospira brenneri]TGK92683.1 phosphoadenylyl-sulfate reductase [Leptospira brenneri]